MAKTCFVFWPVSDPVVELRVFVLAALRIPHLSLLRVEGITLMMRLNQEPCTKADGRTLTGGTVA